MKAIVAVNKKWSIGKDGDLLYSLPTDMRFFRETTKGNTVIMGRKTLDSFPNGSPLKNRTNIVISRTPDSRDVVWASSPLDALKQSNDIENTYLIGGATVYSQLIEYCSEAYVTIVEDDLAGDSFFPNLDEKDNWEIVDVSDTIVENGFSFKFFKYKNNNPKEI